MMYDLKWNYQVEVPSRKIRRTKQLKYNEVYTFIWKMEIGFEILNTTRADVQQRLYSYRRMNFILSFTVGKLDYHVSKHINKPVRHQYYLSRDSEYYALRCACKVRLVLNALNQIESLDRSWLFWACWSGLDWCKLIDSKLDCTNDLTNPD